MDLVHQLKVLLIGDGTSLGASLRAGSTGSEELGAKSGIAQTALAHLGLQGKSTGELIGTGLKVGAAAGAVALGGMAFEGVKLFADMTAEVRGFQRTIGGTAEDASRLAAATGRMGIDAQTAQTAFGQLAKRIGEGTDTLGAWGVEIARNKDHSVNFAETIANISEKYASIKDPAERAAFASENFGKGYQTINSLLGQGKENLRQFYDIAAEHHQIFSQDDLQKGLDMNRGLHDLESAFQGIELELGKALVPAITTLTHGLEFAIGALDKMGGSLSSGTVLAGGFALVGQNINDEWGAGVGGTLGFLAQGMEDFSNRTLHATDMIATFVPALQKMDAAKAASEWEKATKKMSELGDGIDGASNKMKMFKDLADADPASAQKIINGMQHRGEATAAYTKVLDGVVKKHTEAAVASDAAAASIDDLSSKHKTATVSANDQAKAEDAVKKAIEGASQAAADAADKDLGLADARNSVVKAVDAYAKASEEAAAAGGRNDAKNQALSDTLLTTERSMLATASAARAVAASHEKEAEALQGVDDKTKQAAAGDAAYRAELVGLAAGMAPDSPLRLYLEGLIGQLDNAARARAPAKIDVDTSEAHRKLDELEARFVTRTVNWGIDVTTRAGDAFAAALQKGP